MEYVLVIYLLGLILFLINAWPRNKDLRLKICLISLVWFVAIIMWLLDA